MTFGSGHSRFSRSTWLGQFVRDGADVSINARATALLLLTRTPLAAGGGLVAFRSRARSSVVQVRSAQPRMPDWPLCWMVLLVGSFYMPPTFVALVVG